MGAFGQKRRAAHRASFTRLSGGLGMAEFVPASIPPLDKIDRAKLPDARGSAAALAEAAAAGSGLLAATDLSAKLEGLTGLALDRAHDILKDPLDTDSGYYPEELRAQASIIKTTLSTQVRVDENRLRKRELDVMPKLKAIIAEEEKRLGLAQDPVRGQAHNPA